MKKEIPNIFKGTAVLVIGGLAVKVLGAFYRIYLSRLIGPEGIGLYQMAYPIYLMFLSLATAGIPVAVSRMVAEHSASGDETAVRNTLKVAAGLMLLFGGAVSGLLFGSAQWLSGHLLADERAVYAIKALAPSIIVLSLSGVWRGYFQGRLLMLPSALSQLIEQIVRVAVSLLLVVLLLPWGVEHAAAGAAFGAFAGGFAGLIYLWISYYREHSRYSPIKSNYSLLPQVKKLLKFALPIAAMAVLTPLLQTLDSLLVPRTLQQIGYTVSESTMLLGVLGNAWAVLYLPLIVTGALDANLLPRLTALQGCSEKTAIVAAVNGGLHLALFYLFPVVVGLLCFGTTIYRILYGVGEVLLLSHFAPVVWLLGLEQISSGILQALGEPRQPLYSFCGGALFKVPLTVFFCSVPQLNISGAILGTFCGVLFTVCLNFWRIKKIVPRLSLRILPLFLAATGMFLGCNVLNERFGEYSLLNLLFGGSFGIGIYLFLAILLKGIKIKDIEIFKDIVKERG